MLSHSGYAPVHRVSDRQVEHVLTEAIDDLTFYTERSRQGHNDGHARFERAFNHLVELRDKAAGHD